MKVYKDFLPQADSDPTILGRQANGFFFRVSHIRREDRKRASCSVPVYRPRSQW